MANGIKIPTILPICPVSGEILFPTREEVQLKATHPLLLHLLNEMLQNNETMMGIVGYREKADENSGVDSFYQVGTVVTITQWFQKPFPFTPQFVVKGLQRFRILKIVQEVPYYKAEIELLSDQIETPNKIDRFMKGVRSSYQEILELINPDNKESFAAKISKIEDPSYLADFAAQTLPLQVISLQEKQEILETLDVEERLKKVYQLIDRCIIRQEARKEVAEDIRKIEREHFIREEIEALRKQLGEEEKEDVKKFRERGEQAGFTEEAKKLFDEELEKFAKMDPRAPGREYIETWLDWMVSLPWNKSAQEQLDISEAEKILEEDHYGLQPVKRRIVEFLAAKKSKSEKAAVKKLKPEADKGKGPLLCFVGPPGTGKTSVGRSIARAIGTKFVRISLGGVYDEAQIRGHRRTYVGALPGIIIQELKRAGVNNPVFMIDEIDKIGAQRLHGDPSSALLEVLDPEQNYAFVDHYLNVPFDLSKVMFICTGNLEDPIHPALKDRMEIIDFPGYTREEKFMIATRYLVPRQLEANGLTEEQLKFEDEALKSIVRDYTKEAGVRNLEREIGKVCRCIVTKIAKKETTKAVIAAKDLAEILGPKKYISQLVERLSRPGVTIGLAWTSVGGEILFVETEKIPGIKEPELEITGNIEKIMQESAKTALSFVEANLKMLGIPEDRSPIGHKIHIHVPEAAVPKDGPSAGLAMFVALVSLLRKETVRSDVAMTGEITLRGVVLPVGGIKEKVLAAKEAGIKTIILPKENEKDLAELPGSVKEALERKEIEIKFISEMKKALEIALNTESKS